MTDPLARPYWRGRSNVDAITIAAIEAAEKHAGFTFVITQGSYQGTGGDPDSAGTHGKGGVVDFSVRGRSPVERARMIWALRAVGCFAAWLREEWMGDWVDHVHAVLIDHPDLADSAARQVAEYRAGGDGLRGDRPDYHPRPNPIPVFQWPPTEEDDMFSDDDRKLLQAVNTRLAGQGKRDVEWEQREIERDRAAAEREQRLLAAAGRLEAATLRLEQALAKHDGR